MPRYVFDICDECGWHRDEYGIELDTCDEARERAIARLPDIARDELPDRDRHDIICEIRDATDRCSFAASCAFEEDGSRLPTADEATGHGGSDESRHGPSPACHSHAALSRVRVLRAVGQGGPQERGCRCPTST